MNAHITVDQGDNIAYMEGRIFDEIGLKIKLIQKEVKTTFMRVGDTPENRSVYGFNSLTDKMVTAISTVPGVDLLPELACSVHSLTNNPPYIPNTDQNGFIAQSKDTFTELKRNY